MKNVFDKKDTQEIISRIEKLNLGSQPLWGKMSADKMLSHCKITYELIYEDKHPKPNFLLKTMLRLFVKNAIVSEKPYPKNSRTTPAFLIVEEKDFEHEKKRLIAHINKTMELGQDHFDNKESHSFGKLKKEEWNNLFYKHLDHHLRQFGV